jgi:molybdopterin synthase catalytic subunit
MHADAGVHRKGGLDFFEVVNGVRQNPDFRKAGAIATFTGVVREETLRGEKVQKLELEAYEEKANEVLKSICEELRKKPGIVDVQIHHLLGKFSVGEDLVYVLVAGSHREQVFKILEEAVDRYKKEAPIFKKEYVITRKGATEGRWVSERKK